MKFRVLAGLDGGEVPAVIDADATATVADLQRSCAARLGLTPLFADGERLDPATPIDRSPVLNGAVLGLAAKPRTISPIGVAVLDVIAGPNCGRRFVLPATPARVGRASHCDCQLSDSAVSREHLSVQVARDGLMIRNERAADNPLFVGGVPQAENVLVPWGTHFVIGFTVLQPRLDAEGPAAIVGRSDGQLELGVAPRQRHVLAGESFRVDLPAPVESAGLSIGLGVASSLASAVGIVGFALMANRSPVLLLFALLSPLVGVTVIVVQRSTQGRRSRQLRADALDRQQKGEQAFAAAAAREAKALAANLASAPEVVAACTTPTSRVWERTAADPDYLELRVGTGRRPSLSTMTSGQGPARSVDLVDVPITLSLVATPVVGIVGPLEERDQVLRWVVAQLAGAHAPTALNLHAVLPDSGSERWDWLGWLPGIRDLAVGDSDEADQRFRALATDAAHVRSVVGGAARSLPPQHVMIVPDVLSVRRSPGFAALSAAAGSGGVALVLGAADASHLPPECSLRVVTDGVTLRLEGVTAQPTTGTIIAEGMDNATARDIVRGLARIKPAGSRAGATNELPYPVTLSEVATPAALTPEAVQRRWAAAPSPRWVPLGRSREGVLRIDLSTDPHWLVVGTPGSGKSETLRTIIASAALDAPPEKLQIVLVDFGGEASFGACARLPHIAGMVTNLDEQGMTGVRRSLDLLDAELSRRERLFSSAKVDTLEGYVATRSNELPNLARLLVVFDEFADLVNRVNDAEKIVGRLLAKARKYGLNLVIGTQSPRTVSSLASSISGKIGLRMTDEGDSSRIIGDGDCTRIAASFRMRGYMRSGDAPKVEFQGAWSGIDYVARDARCDIRPLRPLPGRTGEDEVDRDASSELEHAVSAALEAARAGGHQSVVPVVPPPLPVVLPLHMPPLQTEPVSSVEVGAIDDVHHQRRSAFAVDFGLRQHLAITGGTRSGKTQALRSIALMAAAQRSPEHLRIAALDLAGAGLVDLEVLPHTLAAPREDERYRPYAMLDSLRQELSRRSARPSGPWPELLLLVDNLPQTIERLDRTSIEHLVELVARGPSLGLTCVLAGGNQIAGDLRRSIPRRLYLRNQSAGNSHDSPPVDELQHAPPGRAFDAESSQWVQLGELKFGPGEVARRWPEAGYRQPPRRLWPFPPVVQLDVAQAPTGTMPLGVLSDRTVALWPYETTPVLLIAGPRRSGKTSLATALVATLPGPGICLVARENQLQRTANAAGWEVRSPADGFDDITQARTVLIDDCDASLLGDRAFEKWIAGLDPKTALVALCRPEDRTAVRRVLLAEGRTSAAVVGLAPKDPDIVTLVRALAGVDISALPVEPVAGRAVFVIDGSASVMQSATALVAAGHR